MLNSINILVINLDKDRDRWNSVQEQADRFGLCVNRVPAVQVEDVADEEIRFVTKGVRAVWRSHMNCMDFLTSSGHTHVIVAEDDFEITNIHELRNVLNDPNIYKFDVVQLGWVVPGLRDRLNIAYSNIEHWSCRLLYIFLSTVKPSSRHIKRLRVSRSGRSPKEYIPDNFLPGGHFYLVSVKFAAAIRGLNNPQFLATDDMYIALAKMRSFLFLRCSKNLVKQKSFPKWEGPRFPEG